MGKPDKVVSLRDRLALASDEMLAALPKLQREEPYRLLADPITGLITILVSPDPGRMTLKLAKKRIAIFRQIFDEIIGEWERGIEDYEAREDD